MKILMVTEWHPSTIGGIQRHVRELSAHLMKKGFEVAILTKANSKKINATENKYAFPIIEVEPITPIQSIITPPSLSKLKKAIEDYSPDIIHAHHAFTPMPLLALYMAEKMKMPKILTNHSIAGNSKDSLLTLMSCKGLIFLRYFISKADKIISVSKSAAKFMENLLGNKVENIIIPNGVDVNRFKPSRREEDKATILFVGRLVHRKGVQVLIKAFSKVVKKIPEAKLIIVGEGYMKPLLQIQVKKLRLNGKVKLLGKVADSELPKIYQEATLVVIPSLYRESFGMVALEAMASGKPVIATKVGGLPEIIRDGRNGFLIPPGDHKELAEKIILLLSNKEMSLKMGITGRKIAVEKYSWNKITSKIINVYLETLKEKSINSEGICSVNFNSIRQTSN